MATTSLSRRLAAGPVAWEPVVLRMMPSDIVLSLPGGATECQGSLNQDWGTATRDGEHPLSLREPSCGLSRLVLSCNTEFPSSGGKPF